MNIESIKNIGKKCYPRPSFREELRADIYENATKKEKSFLCKYIDNIEIPRSYKKFQREQYQTFQEKIKLQINQLSVNLSFPIFRLSGAFLGVLLLSLSLLAMTPSQKIEAMESSIIRNITGNVVISNSQEYKVTASEYTEILPNHNIQTDEDSSAEIVFFGKTVIRLDKNTEVKIIDIQDHPMLSDTGKVTIFLTQGRIWLKTFQSASDNLGIVIQTPEGVIIPSRSSLDFSREKGSNLLRVFSRNAEVLSSGANFDEKTTVSLHKKLAYSPFSRPILLDISAQEINEPWVKMNIEKDEFFRKTLLEKMTTKMQEGFMNEYITQHIKQFFTKNPSIDEVESLFSQINDSLTLATAGNQDLANKTLKEASNSLSEATNIQNIEDLIIGIKDAQQMLEDSENIDATAHITKKAVENIKGKISATKISEIENKTSKKSQNNNTPSLSQIEKLEPGLNEISISREDLLGRYRNAAEAFRDQINKYFYTTSRKNHAEYLLGKIDSTPENIHLLRAIYMSAPEDVKSEVKNKIAEIKKEEDNQNIKNS